MVNTLKKFDKSIAICQSFAIYDTILSVTTTTMLSDDAPPGSHAP